MKRLLSVDIGSTWTKAALFDLSVPRLLGQAQTPTTQADLLEGFQTVIRAALGVRPDAAIERTSVSIRVSSSAKGGLSIAAIGIVPDLTVSVARMAAASAGGRIAASFSYKLGRREIERLEAMKPDIVLLCGGTDGGNESYVLQNARSLASSACGADIIYAGNRAVEDDVRRILADKPLHVVGNVMPEMGRLEIEPARAGIRDLYLRHIVEGKGLDAVRRICGSDPRPTPLTVYELLQSGAPAWEETLLIDMGGATTDVYSVCTGFHAEEGTVLRGIEEPMLTRTVEGDLGMRVSAAAAAETGAAYVAKRLAEEGAEEEGFSSWIRRVASRPERLPGNEREHLFDDILAEACLLHALARHAGRMEEVWTPGGRVRVQRGKDLRGVKRLVASGGWLGRRGSDAPVLHGLSAARSQPGSLLPESPRILADDLGLLPLLGNVASEDPAAAAELARQHMRPFAAAREGVHA